VIFDKVAALDSVADKFSTKVVNDLATDDEGERNVIIDRLVLALLVEVTVVEVVPLLL
jgi:hypothetical protein